ncbi:MAG TPA: type II secretion system minor pseudopilin GspH [Steroidobacteraceae bacterium]|nr:type II secretion system minor pseudopilin GspH [Steroidobacteraceae bacterium]
MRAQSRSAGFTLIEILVVVVIIAILSFGVLLSVSLTGRDRELETESDRLLGLVNYAREQAELQTREFGVVFHDNGYQFVAYDPRRGHWRVVYEDDALRQRKLPEGLDVTLVVESRPVVLTPTDDTKQQDAKPKTQPKTLKDITSLKDLDSKDSDSGSRSGSIRGLDDSGSTLEDPKPITPQVMIYSNGDLTSFEITLERDGGARSITLAQDDKGQVIEKPMVEHKT